VTERTTLAERVVALAYVALVFAEMVLSAGFVGAGLAGLTGTVASLGSGVPGSGAYVVAPLAGVSLMAGFAGLAVSPLAIRTPWSSIARPSTETVSGVRDPVLHRGS
jgi:hypothetical protein